MTCAVVEAKEENTLSPAFAALMAQVLMPAQYEQIMANAMLSVNDRCPSRVVEIEK